MFLSAVLSSLLCCDTAGCETDTIQPIKTYDYFQRVPFVGLVTTWSYFRKRLVEQKLSVSASIRVLF